MTFDTLWSALCGGRLPISLHVDGKEYGNVSPSVTVPTGDAVRRLDAGGVTLTVMLRAYGRKGVELTAELENAGECESAAVTDICFLHLVVPDGTIAPEMKPYRKRVLYAQGSHAGIEDFMPRTFAMDYSHPLEIRMEETRSSSGRFPYFNYCTDLTRGLFAAVGWSGHWSASFSRCAEGTLIRFTYPDACFRLHPGEKLALPSALLVPWETETSSDEVPEAFNLFRRCMKKYVCPPVEGAVCLRAWGSVDRAGHETRWRNMKKYGLTADAYGVDAGWYEIPGADNGDWFRTVGNWEARRDAYPEGIGRLADGGREAGADGFWLWFEFERAMRQSAAFAAHPEYYLSLPGRDDRNLIDMRNPAAREYLMEKLERIFVETQITIFRIDFNIDPGEVFRANEREDCRGLTELQYYNGLYAFFAELLRRRPGLIVDNCASGGRRLDYRMIRYAVPLMCRSDYFCFPYFLPTGAQAQTMALARWLPVQADSCGSCMGTTPITFDTYRVRSSMACGIGIAAPSWELTDEEGAWYHAILAEARRVMPYMSLDFYPLTGYSLSEREWAAWEAVSPSGDRALLMVFRRERSPDETRTFVLRGLRPDALYEITDSDNAVLDVRKGSDLVLYRVTLAEPRSSAIRFITEKVGG